MHLDKQHAAFQQVSDALPALVVARCRSACLLGDLNKHNQRVIFKNLTHQH